MFIQPQTTPNTNSLKFLPGNVISNSGSYEIKKKDSTNNNLIRNVLSISGVKSVFLGVDSALNDLPEKQKPLYSSTKLSNILPNILNYFN